MMKSVLFMFCCVVATALARPQSKAAPSGKEPVPILSLENSVNYDGSYHYAFESGDGTKAEQTGQLKVVGPEPDKAGEASQGSFSFPADDGKTYSVSYTADENGYIPSGEHLPTPPPVPAAIAKAIAYLATLPPPPPEKRQRRDVSLPDKSEEKTKGKKISPITQASQKRYKIAVIQTPKQ